VDVKAAKKKKRQSLDVKLGVDMVGKEQRLAHEEFKNNLNTATVILKPVFGIHTVGIKLEDQHGKFVVVEVSNSGVAILSGMVHVGYILEEINGSKEIVSAECIDSEFFAILRDSKAPNHITLKFLRPDAALPTQGSHRKLFKKEVNYKAEIRQTNFFEETFKNNPLVSRSDMLIAMKLKFGNELRGDNTPLYFPKNYISNLIKDKHKKAKESLNKARQRSPGNAGSSRVSAALTDQVNDIEPQSGFDSDSDAKLSSDEDESPEDGVDIDEDAMSDL